MAELSFRQWLSENGYKQQDKVVEWRLSMGATDVEIEEIDAEYDELADQYLDECEEQGCWGCFD